MVKVTMGLVTCEVNGRDCRHYFLMNALCAYYVHCMAHRLQLALVTAARKMFVVHELFLNLTFVVNAVTGSCKQQDELQTTQQAKIAQKLAIDDDDDGGIKIR